MIDQHQQLEWARRLENLGRAVRTAVIAARDAGADLATAVAHEGGDTIFAIDRHVEPIMEAHIARWPASCFPLMLVAEGMGADGMQHFGDPHTPPRFRLLIDPIDGTRNIMYDKRAAWFIACIAIDQGNDTNLADAFASCMVELPTSKQGLVDSFIATRSGTVTGCREDLRTGQRRAVTASPSTAHTLEGGFAQVSNFFPGTKVLASELMERIAAASLGATDVGFGAIFEDQYISTAGQMVEVMMGRDRFCADLRPLFCRIIAQQGGSAGNGLECHPYDMAGMLTAQRGGVIITDGLGRPLRAPMTVHDGVHWCAYANVHLQRQIEPVIRAFFEAHGVIAEA